MNPPVMPLVMMRVMIRNRMNGIVTFGAVVMILVGTFNAVDGLVALLNPDHFDNDLLVGSLTAWGWLFVIFGGLQILLGIAIFSGSAFALSPGVVLAGANALLQLMFLSSYPVWSAIVMVADGIVIYAFTIKGMELGATNPPPAPDQISPDSGDAREAAQRDASGVQADDVCPGRGLRRRRCRAGRLPRPRGRT